jgi:hypothetical protein
MPSYTKQGGKFATFFKLKIEKDLITVQQVFLCQIPQVGSLARFFPSIEW